MSWNHAIWLVLEVRRPAIMNDHYNYCSFLSHLNSIYSRHLPDVCLCLCTVVIGLSTLLFHVLCFTCRAIACPCRFVLCLGSYNVAPLRFIMDQNDMVDLIDLFFELVGWPQHLD